jgi:hypothetical protein
MNKIVYKQYDAKIQYYYIERGHALRHYATSRRVAGSIPDEVTGFFNSPNSFRRTMALGSTQVLTEITTWNLTGGKGRPGRKADKLTAICEPIDCLEKMWEPRRLTNVWAFTARYRDSLNFTI